MTEITINNEPTKCIRVRVVETCVYHFDVHIPADADPWSWVRDYGDDWWTNTENVNDFFTEVEKRYLSFVQEIKPVQKDGGEAS